jgi:hypothetical protein
MQPTSWDDALDLVARVTVAVMNDMGEDGIFVSAFDHGGAGGGYENTWGTGKLYFGAMKIKNIRIHNRPASVGAKQRHGKQQRDQAHDVPHVYTSGSVPIGSLPLLPPTFSTG